VIERIASHIEIDKEGSNLNSLRTDTLLEFAGATTAIGFLSIVASLYGYFNDPSLGARLIISITLALGSLHALQNRESKPRYAWFVYLIVLLASVSVGTAAFPESPARFLFAGVALISSLVLSTAAIWVVSAISFILLIVLGINNGFDFVDVNQIWAPILLMGLMQFVSWISTRQLSQELKRTKDHDAEIQASMSQVQEHRAQLARTVRSLDNANYQIEKINDQLESQQGALSRRSAQLEAAATIARDVITLLDVDSVLNRVVELIPDAFDYYYAGVFLIDDTEENAVLRAASGEAGKKMLEDNHTVIIDSPGVIGYSIQNQRSIIIPDVTIPGSRFIPNDLLPLTRGEMAYPLQIGQRVIGVLDIQSVDVDAFSQDDATALEVMADQIAISIQNARLFRQAETDRAAALEADRVKTEFLAHMSHELRTPLNAILNFTAFIADGLMGDVNEMQVETLQKVIGSGNHLLNLINDVLDISKIEAGMMQLFIEEVELGEILNSATATARGLSKDKPVTVFEEIDKDLPSITGDRRRIRQIMLNLVSNAVKFTLEGRVTIGASRTESGEVHFWVKDSGIGISPEDQKRVFDSFTQADHDLENITGTGLGLPITKHFVEAHGGKIWVESVLGDGATFHVELPVTMTQNEKDTGPLEGVPSNVAE
jgi:signal transduction histidine kinase